MLWYCQKLPEGLFFPSTSKPLEPVAPVVRQETSWTASLQCVSYQQHCDPSLDKTKSYFLALKQSRSVFTPSLTGVMHFRQWLNEWDKCSWDEISGDLTLTGVTAHDRWAARRCSRISTLSRISRVYVSSNSPSSLVLQRYTVLRVYHGMKIGDYHTVYIC